MKQEIRDERCPSAIEGVSRPRKWRAGWSVDTPEEREEFRASVAAVLDDPEWEVDWGETYTERDARTKAEVEAKKKREAEERAASRGERLKDRADQLREKRRLDDFNLDLERRRTLMLRRLAEAGVGYHPWSESQVNLILSACDDYGFRWNGQMFVNCLKFEHFPSSE